VGWSPGRSWAGPLKAYAGAQDPVSLHTSKVIKLLITSPAFTNKECPDPARLRVLNRFLQDQNLTCFRLCTEKPFNFRDRGRMETFSVAVCQVLFRKTKIKSTL